MTEKRHRRRNRNSSSSRRASSRPLSLIRDSAEYDDEKDARLFDELLWTGKFYRVGQEDFPEDESNDYKYDMEGNFVESGDISGDSVPKMEDTSTRLVDSGVESPGGSSSLSPKERSAGAEVANDEKLVDHSSVYEKESDADQLVVVAVEHTVIPRSSFVKVSEVLVERLSSSSSQEAEESPDVPFTSESGGATSSEGEVDEKEVRECEPHSPVPAPRTVSVTTQAPNVEDKVKKWGVRLPGLTEKPVAVRDTPATFYPSLDIPVKPTHNQFCLVPPEPEEETSPQLQTVPLSPVVSIASSSNTVTATKKPYPRMRTAVAPPPADLQHTFPICSVDESLVVEPPPLAVSAPQHLWKKEWMIQTQQLTSVPCVTEDQVRKAFD